MSDEEAFTNWYELTGGSEEFEIINTEVVDCEVTDS
jgi:hypothetical protein